jgi:hypothetical protein
MHKCNEDELGGLVVSVAAFGILTFGLLLLATYLREGVLLFSALMAGVETLFAIVIFLSLHRLLDVAKTVIVGLVLYTAVFAALYSYVWVAPSVTLTDSTGTFVFRNGSVTLHGLARNLMNGAVTAAISSLAYVLCIRFGLLCGTARTPENCAN